MSSIFGVSSDARMNSYNKSDDVGISREERMNRLKFELREHIRFLADYDMLSTDWLRMAESLHQIANVAFMETHLPPSEDNPLSQHGKKDTGTLWDQERDELAVRILLEEGKLNLTLRILHKYRVVLRNTQAFTVAVAAASDTFHSDIVTVNERCRIFEQSVGVLLKFAFSHVEALQIMDLPEFVQHCAEVVGESAVSTRVNCTPLDVDRMQETLVLHYLSGLATSMEQMDEDRVMDLIDEHKLLSLVIAQLRTHYRWYKADTLQHGLKFINGCMNSESYQADRKKYINDNGTITQLLELRYVFMNEMLASATGPYSLKKKEVQMLIDEMSKYDRTPGIAPSKDVVPMKERLDKYRIDEEKEKDKQKIAKIQKAAKMAAEAGK